MSSDEKHVGRPKGLNAVAVTLCLLVLFSIALMSPAVSYAANYCVDNVGVGAADGGCAATCDGSNDCTLVDALAVVAGGDTIIFKAALGQIDPTATFTVPASVTLDGGANHDTRIDGTGTAGIDCITIGGNSAVVKGLVITNCDDGIYWTGLSGVKIQNNWVGLSTDGSTIVANNRGLSCASSASTNTIGTDGDGVNDAAEGNVFSGNVNEGITMNNCDNHVIAGNIVGLNSAGTVAKANSVDGISLNGGSTSNRIGTNGDGISDSVERNVISGNTYDGVFMTDVNTNSNVVAGNYIGVGADGTTDLGNGNAGVHIVTSAGSQTIGTNGDGNGDAVEGNVIAGNTTIGIHIVTAGSSSVIAGNYVSLGSNGSTVVANGSTGITIDTATGVRIGTDGNGTSDTYERNVIGGGGASGISLVGADSAIVAGNYIGVAVDGTTDKGQASNGVLVQLDTNNATIGGDAASEANIIAFNGDGAGEYGIRVITSTTDGNDFLKNSIHDNQNAGILLEPGCNNDNAAPASITSTTADTPTHDTKKLTSANVSASATVQIFEADDGGSCEGERYIGEAPASGAGAWSYNLTGANNNTGVILVLTETDANGTSAFSSCYTLTNLAPTANAGNDANINETAGQTILNGAASSDPEGTTLTYLWTETADASNACTIANDTTVSPTVIVANKDSSYSCTYVLVVNDGTNNSVADGSVDTVVVNVAAVNAPRRIY